MSRMSTQAAIRILAQAKVEKCTGNPKQARYDRARRLAIEALKNYSPQKKKHKERKAQYD